LRRAWTMRANLLSSRLSSVALRCLADHCIPNAIVRLSEANHEVIRLRDILPADMDHYRGKLLVIEVGRVRIRH